MKILSPLLAMALLSGQSFDSRLPALVQDDDAAKKVQRIRQALGWLENDDADVREMGRKVLQEVGRDAVPELEKRLAEKGAAELLRLIRQFDRSSSDPDAWVSEKELKEIEADEQFRKEAEKLPRDTGEKYVYVKYHEALAHVRQKHYQRAFDMANALLALEPKSVHVESFRRLRRHCENMITQTTLIEAKILQPKVWYAEGETVELAARMKNIYRAPMTLTWEKSAAPDVGGGLLVLEVEISMREIGGASTSDQRHQDLRFEDEVPIAPGAQWERKFTLDTSTAIPDANRIRVVKVGGWCQPAKVATDGVNITRRLQFEPAIVKVVPARYAPFLENPLEALKKAIEAGEVQDAFISSQMLEGEARERGIEVLIGLLEKSTTPQGRIRAEQILTPLTGQAFGADPKRWKVWFQNHIAESEGKDKKKK